MKCRALARALCIPGAMFPANTASAVPAAPQDRLLDQIRLRGAEMPSTSRFRRLSHRVCVMLTLDISAPLVTVSGYFHHYVM